MSAPHLDLAVAPNLFDVIVDPGLAFTLILANLMSSRLWKLRAQVLRSSGTVQERAGDADQSIQELLDHHFEHVTMARVAEMNGLLDLEVVSARYGSATVEHVVSRILATIDWRIKHGTLERDAVTLDLIKAGKFPAYTYATIDEAWAYRRLLKRRKHKPLGLTCCLDEAAIFAALHLTLTKDAVNNVAIIGSPTHYTVLSYATQGTRWFYSKHELYSPSTWSRLVSESNAGDGQAAFDDRLPDFDRIITAFGTFSLTSGETSIPEPRLMTIIARIDEFFGRRVAQLDQALRYPLKYVESLSAASVLEDASSASTADEVRARVRKAALETGNVPALRALHAFRALDLPDLTPYLQSARRSNQIDNLLSTIGTVDDAIRCVAAIGDSASIFDDPERFAMPDETVRFATGTRRDKALLLHILLERGLGIDESTRANVETIISETDSFVRSAGFCISISRMAYVPAVEGRVLHRLSEA